MDLIRTDEAVSVPGRVTFVIPTRSSGRTIGACVASAVTQRGDVEVIVVDNHSTDGTASLAAEAGAHLVLVAGPERSAQRNVGWRAATGEHVVFIDSDMVLQPGLATDVVDTFAADDRLGALVLPEWAFGDGYLAACRGVEKLLAQGDPAVEAARAFRRAVLAHCGGYDERLTGPEDYELPDRVVAAGWGLGRTRAGVDHDEGRVDLFDLFAKKRYYGLGLAALGEEAVHLGQHRSRRVRLATVGRLVARHPRHAPGVVLLKAVDTAGLAVGALVDHRRL